MKGQETRQKIIFCSASLFAKQGYCNTSVQDIGKACGISSAALYYHFASKEEILEHVVIYGLNIVHLRLASILLAEGDIRERLRNGLLAYLENGLEFQDFLITDMENIRYLTGDRLERVKQEIKRFYLPWFAAMKEAERAGLYPPGSDLKMYIRLAHGALRQMLYWKIIGEIDVKLTAQDILDIYLEYRRVGVEF